VSWQILIDCPEEIPCNPCETACPVGCIAVGDDITALPVLTGKDCSGCGRCIAVCPGLAVRIVDLDREVIAIPYEYLPLPETGMQLPVVDVTGAEIGIGTVVRITRPLRSDPTRVMHLKVAGEIAAEARGILWSSPERWSADGGESDA